MSLEIRPITDEEIERSVFIAAYSFNNAERRDLPAAVERDRKFFPNDWSLASFEDGEMTAFLRVIPFAMRINGRGLSFGGVGPVVSSPEHRRKGHVGALLCRALADMRERGQVLSGLHTPHPSLYRRYGWEIATQQRLYKFAPKEIELAAQPSERGRFRLLSPDDWAQADRVYRQHSAKRNGPIHRREVWWRESIFSASQPTPSDIALWENGAGEPEGYVVYWQPMRAGRVPDEPAFLVRELVALTSDAYLNLIAYILRHDLPSEIMWAAPADDPFRSLVGDASKLTIEAGGNDVMLRICDVEQALRQRAPASPNLDGSVTLEVTDRSASWNQGTWRVEVANGEMQVEKSSGEADLSLSATTLAPLYNGFLSPSGAALVGLVRARDEDALARADAFFATLYPPFCADGF
ncbi:MAG: GNAT family N-acetyltransferase [Dehalococcoidia bacterium]